MSLILGALLLIPVVAASPSAGRAEPGGSAEGRHHLGERIYREGILPSGEPMQAVVNGDIPVDGTMFSCVSCHLRSGLGSFEGTTFTPPTNGVNLYRPYRSVFDLLPVEAVQKIHSRYRPVLRRPAYTDSSLADALTDGVDPDGREFSVIMPRYQLAPADLAVLIDYLKGLSGIPPPGVSETTVRFATVVSDEVAAAEREAMLASLRASLAIRNMKPGRGTASRTRAIVLDVWELVGPEEGWPGQLEQHYRAQPVVALVGGISTRDWRPVHEFCERNQIPALFPLTDFPVTAPAGFYTVYLSRGLAQEGEAAARHLAGELDPAAGVVVQVVREGRGPRAVAEGFERVWAEQGRPPAHTVRLAAAETADGGFWRELIERHRPAALLLWGAAGDLAPLEELARGAAPPPLYLSHGLLKESVARLPEAARPFTFVTFPYDPRVGIGCEAVDRTWVRTGGATAATREVIGKSAILNRLLTKIFMDFDLNPYPDYLLDVVDMQPDIIQQFAMPGEIPPLPLFPRVSFGTGQRFAAKGCYIVRLGPGPEPRLEPRSDWLTAYP